MIDGKIERRMLNQSAKQKTKAENVDNGSFLMYSLDGSLVY
jgi:hypothetical protein